MTKRNTIAIATALLAGFVAVWIGSSRRALDEPTARAPASAARVEGAAPARADADASESRARPGAAAPISAALAREYLSSTDLYAFAMRARTRLSEGGRWYAMEAMRACEFDDPSSMLDAEVAKMIAKTGTVSAQQSEALERYRRRCAGFTAGTRGEMSRWLKDRAVARDDPLMNAAHDVSTAATPEARRGALQTMLDLHDPLLTSEMRRSFELVDHVDRGPATGPWFGGVDYRAPKSEVLYDVALQLAACPPGAACAQQSLDELACMAGGDCEHDLTGLDSTRVDEASLDPQALEVFRLARGIRDALERGDVDAFRAPAASRR